MVDAEGGVGGVELSDLGGEGLDGGGVGVHEGWELADPGGKGLDGGSVDVHEGLECDDAICTKRPKTMCGEMERCRSQTH
jgi:hypothetical protein